MTHKEWEDDSQRMVFFMENQPNQWRLISGKIIELWDIDGYILVGGLEHQFYVPRNIGNVLIPIDFHIFQRGSNHQPDDIMEDQHLKSDPAAHGYRRCLIVSWHCVPVPKCSKSLSKHQVYFPMGSMSNLRWNP